MLIINLKSGKQVCKNQENCKDCLIVCVNSVIGKNLELLLLQIIVLSNTISMGSYNYKTFWKNYFREIMYSIMEVVYTSDNDNWDTWLSHSHIRNGGKLFCKVSGHIAPIYYIIMFHQHISQSYSTNILHHNVSVKISLFGMSKTVNRQTLPFTLICSPCDTLVVQYQFQVKLTLITQDHLIRSLSNHAVCLQRLSRY